MYGPGVTGIAHVDFAANWTAGPNQEPVLSVEEAVTPFNFRNETSTVKVTLNLASTSLCLTHILESRTANYLGARNTSIYKFTEEELNQLGA